MTYHQSVLVSRAEAVTDDELGSRDQPPPAAGQPGLVNGPELYVGTDGRRLIWAGAQQAMLVLGPPRSGKTSTLVVPNVLAAPGPVLVTSTKPDVLQATLASRSQLGRCWLLDPTGTVRYRLERPGQVVTGTGLCFLGGGSRHGEGHDGGSPPNTAPMARARIGPSEPRRCWRPCCTHRQ